MRRLGWGVVVLAFGLMASSAIRADDKKDDPKKDAPDAKKDKDADNVNSEKTMKAGQLVGKVIGADETKKSIKIQIKIEYPELNAGEAQALQQAQIQLAQAQAKRDFQGVVNAQNSIAQHSNNLYTVKSVTKDLDIQSTEEVKVRFVNPPPVYDSKGNIKKPTAAELKELKGSDASLPGYEAQFSNLHNEQYVRVSLVKKKDAPKPHPKGKDFDPEAALADLPQASMIEILGEPISK
jgi:hypothetical protein